MSANKSGPETIVLKTNAYAVLAVSRNAETASAIKKLLQQSGESAFVATSAKQAWDEIRIGRVGLVVVDVTDLKMDDVLLLSAARSAKNTSVIPFLFLKSKDYQPLDLIEPGVEPKEESEVVELEAFRYIFKRPVN